MSNDDKHYFGYYSWHGMICAMKWIGDPPIGGVPCPVIQKHQLEDHMKKLDLTALESIYPYEKKK